VLTYRSVATVIIGWEASGLMFRIYLDATIRASRIALAVSCFSA